MRVAVFLTITLLAACASEKLQLAPPVGVDLSGHWQLNTADSDDPQRLISGPINSPYGRNSSSGGGNRGRGAGPGNGSFGEGGGSFGPAIPTVSALSDGVRWPGKELAIKQVGSAVVFGSNGVNRSCRPGEQASGHAGRDAPSTGRDAVATRCGWEDKTLVIQNGDPDETVSSFEERYSLSENGQRLIELVSFRGGHSDGFTMSRVWDRATP